MTKSELIQRLSDKMPGMQVKDVHLAVDCILEQMIGALTTGQRVEIRGFGAFSMRQRAARKARNPKTGEAVLLPPRTSLYFKPGKDMADRVDAARLTCKIRD